MTIYALLYDYGALEPYISGEIMELHHGKHYDTYVSGINSTVDQLAEAREAESFGSMSTLDKNLAFHLDHSVFWANMSSAAHARHVEHAYYRQYKNGKKTFVEQWWNVVNWADVQARFEKSKTQTPGLIIP